jgi:hypothetical protein
MRKYVAHLVQDANGPLICECTDTITCGNCVQVNLVADERKHKANEEAVKDFIKAARKHGIRRTAREIGEAESTLRRWINSEIIPAKIIEKYGQVRHGEA